MKLVVDVCLSPQWAGLVRANGHDALHWTEVGPQAAPDPDIMAWAGERGYVVLTQDHDFGQLLFHSGADGPGVIRLDVRTPTPTCHGLLVLSAIAGYEARQPGRYLVRIRSGEGRTKFTILPLSTGGGQAPA